MSWVQTVDQVNPVAQAAMTSLWVNYMLSVQTAFATTTGGASLLFDGSIMVPSVWQPYTLPWQNRGRPMLVVQE